MKKMKKMKRNRTIQDEIGGGVYAKRKKDEYVSMCLCISKFKIKPERDAAALDLLEQKVSIECKT